MIRVEIGVILDCLLYLVNCERWQELRSTIRKEFTDVIYIIFGPVTMATTPEQGQK